MMKTDRQERDKDDRSRKYTKFRKDRRCRFCRDKVKTVDYKDVLTIVKLCTSQGKLYGRKRSGNCAFHQRSSQTAVRRSRFMAFVPYIGSGAI